MSTVPDEVSGSNLIVETGPAPGGMVRRHLAIPLFRNAYALVVTTAMTSVLGIVYWGLAAHYYQPVDVGRATAAISALMLIGGATQLNLINVLPRFLPQAAARSKRLVLGAYGASAVLAILVAGIYVTLGAADRIMAAGPSPWGVRVGFVAAVVAWSLFTLQDSVLAGLRQAVYVPVENALFALAKIGLLVLLAASMPKLGLFASWTVPAALAIVPVSVLIFGRLLPRHAAASAGRGELPGRSDFLRYVAGEYLGGLFQLSAFTVMPLIVVSVVGLEANAYFSTAWIVAASFDLILANIGVSFTVEGAIDGERLLHLARSAARLSAAIVIPGALAIVVVAPWVLTLLGGDYRTEGVGVLRLLAIAMPFRAVTVLYLSLARVNRRVRSLVVAQAVACIVALGLARVLLPHLGIDGAALAYLVAQVLVAVAVAPSVIATLRQSPSASAPGPAPS